MGHSIIYHSVEKVSAKVRKAVLAEAQSIVRDWWVESFIFFDNPEAKGKLYGDTKISVTSYTTSKGKWVEVDVHDDAFMSERDVTFIIKQLAKWSKEHGINWIIEDSYAGEVGTISNGVPSKELKQYAIDIGSLSGKRGPTGVQGDKKAAAIRKKHRARWDE